MEMCYDGALVMPSNYAIMDEEEMTYVEGGISCKKLGKIIDGAITIISFICGVGSGIKLVKTLKERAKPGAVLFFASTALKWAGLSLASSTIMGIYGLLSTFTDYTIGNGIAYCLDMIDRVKNDGNVSF